MCFIQIETEGFEFIRNASSVCISVDFSLQHEGFLEGQKAGETTSSNDDAFVPGVHHGAAVASEVLLWLLFFLLMKKS